MSLPTIVNRFDMDELYGGGSTLLRFLCEPTSLSLDKVNFLFCQLLALLLGHVLKTWSLSPTSRHSFTLISGLFLATFCFGLNIGHVVLSALFCHLIMRIYSKSRNMPWLVLLVAMFYLCTLHMRRQISARTQYCLDITGPLMVVTQKVTSLAFSLRDGLDKEKQETEQGMNMLTSLQRRYAVSRLPGSLEYWSYVFQFQSFLAGPSLFYADYIRFIQSEQISPTSSPYISVVSKLAQSLLFAILFLKLGAQFDSNIVRDPDFLEHTSWLYKMVFLGMCTTVERFKYYHAWLLADAICNISGLGYDETKNNWDAVSNAHAFAFETGTNLKVTLDNWNIGTTQWLRHVAYERSPSHLRTGVSYLLCAVWHGFYPGYYLNFLTAALFTLAARAVRRNVRPFFVGRSGTKAVYDIGTFLTTRLSLAYFTFPFVVQDLGPAIALYTRVYYFMHILAIAALFVLPSLSRGMQLYKPHLSRKLQEESFKIRPL